MAITNETSIITLSAPTNFPIKLTSTNFPVWRKQVYATLIGLGLAGYVDGTTAAPAAFSDTACTTPNPAYQIWYRQDQILLSALLGSCSDTIQPVLASATTAANAWDKLTASFANASRGRVISLKSKLANNPRGSKSISDYLQEMQTLADNLALVQAPVADEDLVAHTLSQIGDDFHSVTSAIHARETPISFLALREILLDCERRMKSNEEVQQTLLATANVVQRNRPKNFQNGRSFHGPKTDNMTNSNWRPAGSQSRFPASGDWNGKVCRFCHNSGHETCVCRKLARFLRENNVRLDNIQAFNSTQTPVVNSTTTTPPIDSTQWLFDSGASHHATSNLASLQNFSDYGGLDEILLGDGKSLNISHTGHTTFPTNGRDLSLSGDLVTGAPLLKGENNHNVYCASVSTHPQLNVTVSTSLPDWHHRFGHPSNKTLSLSDQPIAYSCPSQSVSIPGIVSVFS
ncbi:PREDICTED: uncharacterized protein LOC109174068 [Ipomoea nil]|uniref:uncharacterized protein LOC109174068 n=1 Tax=Ipomoea nil TaxID=35883 RepID=UPI000900EE4E|nr:PREDICTED: uncharacterized protein LOC109174068 [Ipomoea nil]